MQLDWATPCRVLVLMDMVAQNDRLNRKPQLLEKRGEFLSKYDLLKVQNSLDFSVTPALLHSHLRYMERKIQKSIFINILVKTLEVFAI